MYLVIVEVSQKQEYIFSSLRLKDNVLNSENIDLAVSREYFKDRDTGFSDENMVYSGGGHTVLEFSNKEEAVGFVKKLTKSIRDDFKGMELFAKVMEYDESKTPAENMENLYKELEMKKAERKTAFKRLTFGINKREIINPVKVKKRGGDEFDVYKGDSYKGYKIVNGADRLGGTKGESNFIAVVHIDGNSMGRRVKELREQYGNQRDWGTFKGKLDEFSSDVDRDFKKTYDEMLDEIINELDKGKLKNNLSIEKNVLPVRKLILAGDDVSFVCDGRIGLECAGIFLKKLSKKVNGADGKKYTAAAGVCIVHAKFPFYRAYNIAEGLCKNAKSFIAGEKRDGCAIDWHIEYGEMEDSIKDIKKDYIAKDGTNLMLRPYFVGCKDEKISYENFRRLVIKFQEERKKRDMDMSRGKMKGLRDALRQGEVAAGRYIVSNRISDIYITPMEEYNNFLENREGSIGLKEMENVVKSMYIEKSEAGSKKEKKCILFDPVEIMDTFIAIEGGIWNEDQN